MRKRKTKMREKGLTKVKIKAIDPQNFIALQKILIMPRAYESLNPGQIAALKSFFIINCGPQSIFS
jgi:hypothetical protein